MNRKNIRTLIWAAAPASTEAVLQDAWLRGGVGNSGVGGPPALSPASMLSGGDTAPMGETPGSLGEGGAGPFWGVEVTS